jgi:hypothetical protein
LFIASSTLSYWIKINKQGKLKEVSKERRPLTEVEMELAISKVECGLLKKPLRSLPRSRCQVCGHERDATQVFYFRDEPDINVIGERIL